MTPFDLAKVSHRGLIALSRELDRRLLDPTLIQVEFMALVEVANQLAAEMRRRLLDREVGLAREAACLN